MKELLAISGICISLFFTACRGCGDENQDIANADSAKIESAANNILPYWGLDIVAKTVKKDSLANWDALNADSLISGLNGRNPEIKLEILRISNDTCYIIIKNPYFLTQEMGSSGADQYISEVVINLTAVKGIDFVNFNFKEGMHASPGIYGKDYIAGYKIID